MSQSNPHQHNILVVDDTPENLAVLTQTLIKQGYSVRPAINGQVTLKAIHKTCRGEERFGVGYRPQNY